MFTSGENLTTFFWTLSSLKDSHTGSLHDIIKLQRLVPKPSKPVFFFQLCRHHWCGSYTRDSEGSG